MPRRFVATFFLACLVPCALPAVEGEKKKVSFAETLADHAKHNRTIRNRFGDTFRIRQVGEIENNGDINPFIIGCAPGKKLVVNGGEATEAVSFEGLVQRLEIYSVAAKVGGDTAVVRLYTRKQVDDAHLKKTIYAFRVSLKEFEFKIVSDLEWKKLFLPPKAKTPKPARRPLPPPRPPRR